MIVQLVGADGDSDGTERADDLADKSLNTVETHFPIVKQETHEVKDTALSYAFFPFFLAGQGRDYIFHTWNDEYSKTVNRNNRGPGLPTTIMAIISTELKVAADAFQVIADYFGPQKEAAKQKKDNYAQQAKQKKDSYAAKAQEKSY